MSRIRGRDTEPEKAVRSMLRRMGYKLRLYAKDLPGRPDIVLPRRKTAVFVHGCFWHRHPRCKNAYTPKSRVAFWERKFSENVERDKVVRQHLRQTGWKRVVIWECQTPDAARLRRSLSNLLRSH
jgi:DNA mismatch endonuclease (patch repair protein)